MDSKPKLRIALWHNLPSGGGKRALYYHVRGLLQRGHIIKGWRPPEKDTKEYLPLPNEIEERTIELARQPAKFSTSLISSVQAFRNSLNNLKAMDEHSQQCAYEINRGGFDVLFANACEFYRVTSIASYVDIPSVLYLGEPFRWLYEALPTLPWLALDPFPRPRFAVGTWALRRIIQNLVDVQALRIQAREECRNAAAFNRILVNSLYSRESVLRAYGLNSNVCYLGVDTTLFRPLGLPRENLAIGVGAIAPEKNIDFILHSVATLSEPRPKVLWIGNVASEAYAAKLSELAKTMRISLELKTRVTDEELVTALNRARLMLYAPRLEPFGFAPLEANACGLPVVAVAEGGVRESVQDGVNGLLVAHDPERFGAAIDLLLGNDALWGEISNRARCFVTERWSLDSAIDQIEAELIAAVEKDIRDNRSSMSLASETVQAALKSESTGEIVNLR